VLVDELLVKLRENSASPVRPDTREASNSHTYLLPLKVKNRQRKLKIFQKKYKKIFYRLNEFIFTKKSRPAV